MLIRLLRTPESREAYRIYDESTSRATVEYCTKQLSQLEADLELSLLRGVCFLEDQYLHVQGSTERAIADFEACFDDPAVAGLAHYCLGGFLHGQGLSHHQAAWEHYQRATELGWVEGHIGTGLLLLDDGFRVRDNGDEGAAKKLFRRAYEELTIGLTSPSVPSKKRAFSLRGDVLYNLGNHEAAFQDKKEGKRLVGPDPIQGDPRGVGS